MLERSPPAVGVVAVLLGHDDGQHAQEVGAGADGHQVEWPRRPPCDHAHLSHARADQGGGQRDARWHPLPELAQAPDPEAVRRVQPGSASGQRADRLEDGGDARTLE